MKKEKRTKLIIDNREQNPLAFREEVFDEILTKYVPFADYWLEVKDEYGWCEIPIVFERKSLGDLWKTMVPSKSDPDSYERFKRMLGRAKDMDCHVILLIEGSMTEVHKGYEYSQFKGESMLKKLAMLRVRYDLEYHFCNTRREMARWIEEIFGAMQRNWTRFGPPQDEPKEVSIKEKYGKKK